MIYLTYSLTSSNHQPPITDFASPHSSTMSTPKPQENVRTSNCGIRKVNIGVRSLIFGGEIVERGEWPWLVAIFVNEMLGLKFSCGGTLISTKAILTAAHCIVTTEKTYKPKEILLYFGQHNRFDWNEANSLRMRVEEIIIHPDYDRRRVPRDADIAILLTKNRVMFNEFIQPVCLWSMEDDRNIKIDAMGTIVGWGRKSIEQMTSTIPRKIELPMVSRSECLATSQELSMVLSNRTFCAGTLDGNGPCHGDSGMKFRMSLQMKFLVTFDSN